MGAQIIRTFVKRINVYAAEKVDGYRCQRVQTIYNCIGEFHAPGKEKNGIADITINYAEFFKG